MESRMKLHPEFSLLPHHLGVRAMNTQEIVHRGNLDGPANIKVVPMGIYHLPPGQKPVAAVRTSNNHP